MKVVLLLITGKHTDLEGARTSIIDCGGLPFYLTEEKLDWQGASVDLVWLRPKDCPRRSQVTRIAMLNPEMQLRGEAGDYQFSFVATGCKPLQITRSLKSSDILAVLIRHWADLPGAGITGLGWKIKGISADLAVGGYLGTRGGIVADGDLRAFMAALRANDEVDIVKAGEIYVSYVVGLIREACERHVAEARRDVSTLTPSASRIFRPLKLPIEHEVISTDEKQVIWIYPPSGEESEIAKRTKSFTDCSASKLVIVSSDSWPRENGRLVDLSGVAVRRHDIVLSHGFKESVKGELSRIGVEVVDYSTSDEAWELLVDRAGRACRSAMEMREALLAYVDRVVLRRRPSDLVRRILHRAINRLAPVRIDVEVLEELARMKDLGGIKAQLADMGRAWSSQLGTHPWCSLASFHKMLVGEVSGTQDMEINGQRFHAILLDGSEALAQSMGELFSEVAHDLLHRIINLSGLRKEGSAYYCDHESSLLKYFDALNFVVFKYPQVAEQLVCLVQDVKKGDLLATWANIDGFSYAGWLEEISALLEGLYAEIERV